MGNEKRPQISFRITTLDNLSIFEAFKALHNSKKEKFKLSFSRTIETMIINCMKKEIIGESEEFVLESVEKSIDWQNRELINRLFARSDKHTIELVKWLHSIDSKLNFTLSLLSESRVIDLDDAANNANSFRFEDAPWAIELKKRMSEHYNVQEEKISRTRRNEAINNSFIRQEEADEKVEIRGFEINHELDKQE